MPLSSTRISTPIVRSLGRLAFVALAVSGCGNPTGGFACPDVASAGITVTIRDASTGAPRAGLARGAVRDGAFVDSLVPSGFDGPFGGPEAMRSRQAAIERPGRYDVAVEHPGYAQWTASNVVVTAGRCGVGTRHLTADLVPLG